MSICKEVFEHSPHPDAGQHAPLARRIRRVGIIQIIAHAQLRQSHLLSGSGLDRARRDQPARHRHRAGGQIGTPRDAHIRGDGSPQRLANPHLCTQRPGQVDAHGIDPLAVIDRAMRDDHRPSGCLQGDHNRREHALCVDSKHDARHGRPSRRPGRPRSCRHERRGVAAAQWPSWERNPRCCNHRCCGHSSIPGSTPRS